MAAHVCDAFAFSDAREGERKDVFNVVTLFNSLWVGGSRSCSASAVFTDFFTAA